MRTLSLMKLAFENPEALKNLHHTKNEVDLLSQCGRSDGPVAGPQMQ